MDGHCGVGQVDEDIVRKARDRETRGLNVHLVQLEESKATGHGDTLQFCRDDLEKNSRHRTNRRRNVFTCK